MKYQSIKRILAGVMISTMLCTSMAAAAEPAQENVAAEETQIIDENKISGEAQVEDTDSDENEEDENKSVQEEQDDLLDTEREESVVKGLPEEGTQEAEEEIEAEADAATEALIEEYTQWLQSPKGRAAVGTYESELAKFPESYKPLLEELHKKHPDWIFVAKNTGLDWNAVVKAESVSGSSKGTNRSLLPKSSNSLLLSKASSDYNASKGTYKPKDGSTWVSASKPAVAYYTDPRNFLTDSYAFVFEALDYNASYHTLAGVENILKGTDLYKRKVTYLNTKGQKISTNLTYGQIILAAGAKYKISPLFLAAKIKQETGAKLSCGSISGNFSYRGVSYRGYYNFFNIGATSTSTGSAVANGLSYAKGGKSYSRPWISPLLSINGGAEFLAKSYISKGQNTVYFQRFNTVYSPYYQHQYMQNLTAAASEAKSTYNSYKSMGIMNDAYVFYIPVYKNMPSQSTTVSIAKSVKTGTISSSATLRRGPYTGYSKITTIPKGATVTALGGVYTDSYVSVSGQQTNPYWMKVTYKNKTGYVAAKYVKMKTDSTIKIKGTKQLKVTCSNRGEIVYYETSNPAVATVNSSGKVTGVKSGTCMIYAISSSGKMLDAIGIKVSNSKASSLSKPSLVKASNSKNGVTVKWKKVSGAKGYYIYRKKSGGKWSKIGKVTSGKKVTYTDKKAVSGTKYYYTVKAYSGSKVSGYNSKGVSTRYLSRPALKSAKGTDASIKVTWKKVKGAGGYYIYRKKSGGKWSKIATVKKGSTVTYTDKNASSGKTYYYTVKAYKDGYKSVYNGTGVKGKRTK